MRKYISIISLFVLFTILSCSALVRDVSLDITQNKFNSLSDSSKQLLDSLEHDLEITVYSPEIEILNICNNLLTQYHEYSKKIKIRLQQTTLDPHLAGQLKVFTNHNVEFKYGDNARGIDINITDFNEQKISTTIQKVMHESEQWLVFVTGHNEADPMDTSNFGLSQFATIFKNQGMQIATLNLAQQTSIPHNTNTLVIANPQHDFLPLEKALLHQYLHDGGNLLWFTEPGSQVTAMLAEEFGLRLANGIAIDLDSSKLGSPHPAVKIITAYPEHAITNKLKSATVLPWSGHLKIAYQVHDWQPNVFLTTAENSWTYVGPETLDPETFSKYKEETGPLNIAIALSRNLNANKQQRAVVIADSSFILNKYLPLHSNKQLVTNLVAWVQKDPDNFIFIPHTIKGLSYHPSKLDIFLQRYVFTLILPFFFVGIGFFLQRR